MSNVFTETPCLAVWNFESGALTTDSKGTNTLIPSTSAPTEDTGDFKQGSCCANYVLASDQFYRIADADLPAGWPFKNGDTGKVISLGFWVKFAALSGIQPIVTKASYLGSGFALIVNNTSLQIVYDSTTNSITGASMGTNIWYYIGISLDGINNTLRYYVYRSSTDSVLTSGLLNLTTSPTSNASDFRIGAFHGDDTTRMFGGKTDELVVFNRLVSNIEWELIRLGTYESTNWELRVEQTIAQTAFYESLGLKVEQTIAQTAFYESLGLKVEQAIAQVAWSLPTGLLAADVLAEVVHNLEPVVKVAQALVQIEVVRAAVGAYVSQFAVQVEWIPLTNLQIGVDSIQLDITPLDSSLQFVTVPGASNILIEALSMFPPGYGVAVSTENILINTLNIKAVHSVQLSTIALEMVALAISVELLGKRRFPMPPPNRVLQTQTSKRQFPISGIGYSSFVPMPPLPPGGTFSFNVVLADAGDFTLPISGSSEYFHNFIVQWGDLSTDTHITAYNDPGITHHYDAPGTYTIIMTGRCDYFSFDEDITGSKLLITELLSFTGDMGFKVLNFSGCINITTIVPLGTLSSLETASLMFSECVLLTTVPEGMFNGCPNILDFNYTFQSCHDLTTLPVDLFRYNTEVTSFKTTFGWCYNFPSTVPTDLFRYNTKVTTFRELFTFCPIDTIPADIFRYNTLVTDFSYVFDHKEQLVTIPEDLFRYNVLATNFSGAFAENYVLENVPVDLFRYNVLATDFSLVFYQSTSLTNVPVDLFRYNVLAQTFWSLFYGSGIVTVPEDFFRYNVLATNFIRVFWMCENLETVPADLFRYNLLAESFYLAFEGCIKLQLHSTIFYGAGETGTRFLNRNVSFVECFDRSSFIGIQGTAPDLWNCDFGTGTPITTDCFDGVGNSITSLTNYASIPTAWGGPA